MDELIFDTINQEISTAERYLTGGDRVVLRYPNLLQHKRTSSLSDDEVTVHDDDDETSEHGSHRDRQEREEEEEEEGGGRDTGRSSDGENIYFFASDLLEEPTQGGNGGHGDGTWAIFGGSETVHQFGDHSNEIDEGQLNSSDSGSNNAIFRRTGRISRVSRDRNEKAESNERNEVKNDERVEELTSPVDMTVPGTATAAGPRKYLRSKEEIRREAEKEFRQRHAFKPTVSRAPTGSKHQRPVDISQRIEEMNAQREQELRNREKMKRDHEKLELLQCTFQPQISRKFAGVRSPASANNNSNKNSNGKNNSSVKEKAAVVGTAKVGVTRAAGSVGRLGKSPIAGISGPMGGSPADATQRLYMEAQQREQQQRFLQRAAEESRLNQYTFQPAVNPASSQRSQALDYLPIHERVGELQKEKNRHLQNLRLSREEEMRSAHTFTPKIDKKSERMAEKRMVASSLDDSDLQILRRRRDDVGTRLQREALVAERRMKDLKVKVELDRAKEMEPAGLSEGTQKLVKSQHPILSAKFADRQRVYQAQLTSRAIARQKAAEDVGASWFRPAVTETAATILAEKRPEILNESFDDRVNRLAKKDAEEIAERRREIEKEMYGDLSFQPHIDPVSRELGRDSSLKELVENKRGKYIKEAAIKKAQERENEQHSFHPKVNKYPIKPEEESMRFRKEDIPLGWRDCPIDQAFNTQLGLGNYFASGAAHDKEKTPEYIRATISLKEPEKMARDIRIKQLEKEEKRREEIILREVKELEECTFQPVIQSINYHKLNRDEPVVVRGIGRHMELQYLSARKKAEKTEREKEAFQVRNIEKFRRPEDGSTIVKKNWEFYTMCERRRILYNL